MSSANTDFNIPSKGAAVAFAESDSNLTSNFKRGRKEDYVQANEADPSLKRYVCSGNGRGRDWDDMFAALVAYKEVYGHTNCPYYYEEDRALGDWVHKQRKHSSQLEPEQADKLNSIGFDWSSTQERLCKFSVLLWHF